MCHSGTGSRGESMRKEDEVKRNANCKMCSNPIFISHIMKSPYSFHHYLYAAVLSFFQCLIRSSSFSLLGRERIRNPLSWYYYTTTATVVLWWYRNTRTVGNDDETKNVSCYTNIKFTYFSLPSEKNDDDSVCVLVVVR